MQDKNVCIAKVYALESPASNSTWGGGGGKKKKREEREKKKEEGGLKCSNARLDIVLLVRCEGLWACQHGLKGRRKRGRGGKKEEERTSVTPSPISFPTDYPSASVVSSSRSDMRGGGGGGGKKEKRKKRISFSFSALSALHMCITSYWLQLGVLEELDAVQTLKRSRKTGGGGREGKEKKGGGGGNTLYHNISNDSILSHWYACHRHHEVIIWLSGSCILTGGRVGEKRRKGKKE